MHFLDAASRAIVRGANPKLRYLLRG